MLVAVGLSLASCTGLPAAQPPPMSQTVDPAAAVEEVVELHRFFAAWFRAELPDTDEAFARFDQAMAPDFEMVVPAGTRVKRVDLVPGLRQAHGSWADEPDAVIEVRGAEARPLAEGLVLVSYEEWQRRDGGWKARRSTALLRPAADAPGGFVWLQVHETWMPE